MSEFLAPERAELEAALRNRFGFSERDLEENRRGRLSWHQMQAAEARARNTWSWRVDATVAALAAAITVISVATTPHMSVGAGGLAMLAVGTSLVVFCLMGLLDRVIFPTQGPWSVTGPVTYRDSRRPVLRVDPGRRATLSLRGGLLVPEFHVDADDRPLVESIGRATVYYGHNGRLLSIDLDPVEATD